MKREMYYDRKFKTKEELIRTFEEYMDYYITRCIQRELNVLTPMEYHEEKLLETA